MILKYGEYVRTHKGIITKVLAYEDLRVYRDGEEGVVFHSFDTDNGSIADEDIKYHSENIIDLIEVGDYVNGKRVIQKWEEPDWREYFIKLDGEETVPTMRNIESIVTHEQFNSIKYVLGGKE